MCFRMVSAFIPFLLLGDSTVDLLINAFSADQSYLTLVPTLDCTAVGTIAVVSLLLAHTLVEDWLGSEASWG